MLSLRTIVAVTCLATAVVSNAVAQSRTSERAPSQGADLRMLVGDLAAQLRLAYRGNLPEYTQRHEQLRGAILAWNASRQSAAEHQQMAAWLRSAIRNSMPGSAAAWPPVPTFGRPASEEPIDGDPFRDDPLP